MEVTAISDVKPLHIEVRVRNNRLRQSILDAGYKTFRAFAAAVPVSHSLLSAYITTREKPFNDQGQLKPIAQKIADFLGESVEYLWPEEVLAVVKNRVEQSIDMDDLVKLGAGIEQLALPESVSPPNQEDEFDTRRLMEGLHSTIGLLSPREQLILRMRYGLLGEEEADLDGIGRKLGLSRERVRQLEARALKKLRDSAPAQRLHPLLKEEPGDPDTLHTKA